MVQIGTRVECVLRTGGHTCPFIFAFTYWTSVLNKDFSAFSSLPFAFGNHQKIISASEVPRYG